MASSSTERENYVYLAKLAEQAERYDEMMDAMKNVAKLKGELTAEERNLLSIAFKNAVGSRRASWRVLSSIETKERATASNDLNVKRISDYKKKVESEMSNICNDIVSIIDEHLIPSFSGTAETKIFYNKVKGDYYRYLAEFKVGDEKKEVADQSMKAYKEATAIAEDILAPNHPIRLGVALNYSVLYNEILNSPESACDHAKRAFDAAISEHDNSNNHGYEDTVVILQLLRDNLTLWTPEIPKDEAEETQKGDIKAGGTEDAQ